MRLCTVKVASPQGVRDTLLVLSEQYAQAAVFDAEGTLPAIRCGKARELDRRSVTLSNSVSVMNLADPMVVDALAEWLVEHPRVHVALEAPRREDAQTACDRLRQKGLRAERFEVRGGTAIAQMQIRRL
jgi:nucleotide-binding universal stress UspA family protein